MSRPRHPAAITLAVAAAMLAAGCGSSRPAARQSAAPAVLSGSPSLQTSLVTTAGTWAVAVMGYAAGHNNFWQLFGRSAGGTRWRLVTPPGVPDNGGLALADTGGRSLITAFRPSQYLGFTPLTATSDGGQAWLSVNPIDAALANVPDALAAAPGSGHLLALLTDGTVKIAAPGGARWSTLASQRSLAASAAARCGLRDLTAAAFSPSGVPLLAGGCGNAGTAGIFAYSGSTWQAAGPPLPATLARDTITVLRLTRTASGTVALLAAGTGTAVSVLAAWSADSGRRWTLSPPVRLNGAHLTSTSFGPGGAAAIVLNGNRGQTVSGAGAPWRGLPVLPPATATLAPGPAGGFDALATTHPTTLTVWQLAPGSATWAKTQTINVPIQFGSSA